MGFRMEQKSNQALAHLISAPGFILPWLDRFYEPEERAWLETLAVGKAGEVGIKAAADLGGMSVDRLLRRGVVRRDAEGTLLPADFHTRYDIWATFEGFKDIPEEIRDRLNQWELAYYIDRHQGDLALLAQGKKPGPERVIPRYLLLDEAFAVVDEANRIYLWPCNCRSMMDRCSKPVFTCIRFENSQGQGYEISREKAKQVIARANKKGLMQSGELGRDSDGNLTGAICNCCPDCCFPHLMATELKAEKVWPQTRYRAVRLKDACTDCALCARRCPFHAFVYDRKKKKGHRLAFDDAQCRGCGLCEVTCPADAIKMEKLDSLY